MFEGLKSLSGLASLMRDLPKVQAATEAATREIAAMRLEGRAGGGVVVAVASGTLELCELEIAAPIRHALADPAQHEMATALILEAVNDALSKARAAAGARMQEVARDLGMPVPPGGGGGGILPGL